MKPKQKAKVSELVFETEHLGPHHILGSVTFPCGARMQHVRRICAGENPTLVAADSRVYLLKQVQEYVEGV